MRRVGKRSRTAWRLKAPLTFAGALIAVGMWLIFRNNSTAQVLAGLGTVAGGLGITWRSAATSLGHLSLDLGKPLWGAEIDAAVGTRRTPPPQRDHVPDIVRPTGTLAPSVARAFNAGSRGAPWNAPERERWCARTRHRTAGAARYDHGFRGGPPYISGRGRARGHRLIAHDSATCRKVPAEASAVSRAALADTPGVRYGSTTARGGRHGAGPCSAPTDRLVGSQIGCSHFSRSSRGYTYTAVVSPRLAMMPASTPMLGWAASRLATS